MMQSNLFRRLMQWMSLSMLLMGSFATATLISGCQDDAGDDFEDAVEDAGDSVNDAVEDMGDSIEDATN